jgi:hypothetical protein
LCPADFLLARACGSTDRLCLLSLREEDIMPGTETKEALELIKKVLIEAQSQYHEIEKIMKLLGKDKEYGKPAAELQKAHTAFHKVARTMLDKLNKAK